MIHYTCKCGKREFWGSGMSPAPCDPCSECKTVPGYPPKAPTPHEFAVQQVETDNGPQPLSRCRFCLRTKNQIVKDLESS